MAFHSKNDSRQGESPTMSFPTKFPLRPLVIPDPDPEKDLASGMPPMSNSQCNNLKSDCLPSPANPARWKGASNRARFGLDIGGTLCKVVYFEPFDNFGSCTPLSTGAGYSTPLEHGHKLSEDCCCLSGSTFRDFCDDSKLATQDLSSWSKDNIEQDSLSNADAVPDTRVPGLCQLSQLHLRDGETDEEHLHDNLYCGRQSLSHVQKIWKPSHDPVLLPGRGTLHFKCFETWRMEEFLFLSKEHSLVTDKRALGATGGGAKKFIHQFLDIAGLRLYRADELKSLVRGIDFLMKHAQHESFEYPKGSFQGGVIQRPLRSPEDHHGNDGEEDFFEEEGMVPVTQKETRSMPGIEEMQEMENEDGVSQNTQQGLYPYLVVNIGSGVSILLVESPDQFKRVGGTSLGGSTFFGLASILTGCTSFEEAIDLAAEGDSTEIDMLVGDIYGGDYSEMGLAATTVASSFGKLVHPTRRATAMKHPQHLAKAALLMITNNIGSLAKLHAQATGVHHVLFTGSFMHGNKLAMRLLTVAMDFWSKGQIKAIFLRHEGHAGSMGALLCALDPTNPTDALLLSL